MYILKSLQNSDFENQELKSLPIMNSYDLNRSQLKIR